MTAGALLIWTIGLAVAFTFGWAHGRRSALPHESAPPPVESAQWRAGYVAGFDDAREEAIKLARAHDVSTIERIATRMDAKP